MNTEKANATAAGQAGILKMSGVAELGRLCGVYDAVNRGPVEHLRSEYNDLTTEIDRLIARNEAIDALLRQRDAIPFEEKWQAAAPNHVTNEGANLALDTFLAGSAYTVTGPYMGLISSVSYTTTAVTDTAAQINGSNGWKEAGSSTNFPLYTTPRKTAAWSAASAKSKALSAALVFPIITTGGTVKGCFLIFGAGAVTTIANTSGVLYSAGVFTGGDKVVAPGDSLSVTYTASL